ncbi:ATP-binding protein [Streptomyces sp. NPDC088254]|uniref:ATP-binding protein n=1 Tax=Streptomyces sp. NPDC088254 TaxID=3365847 RepID=UPI0038151395
MIELPDLVAGGLAVGTLSALALGGGLLRSRRQRDRQRAEIAALRTQLDGTHRSFVAEVEHLAVRRVPAAARQVAHPHVEVPGPLQPLTAGTPVGVALENVLLALQAEVVDQRTRVDAAAQAGMRGATREIQAALYRLQDALRGLQQRYDDPELAQTLFQLDHENEQSLRRAQVTAVVCGAWVGLAREESHLVDAVTGGQARLAGYHRVQVHNHLEPGTALVSHAVEPVAIIVAELLDNALRHSAPETDVVVSLQHVHHGVCVTVDDAGLGMTRDERERAQRLVAGDTPILLTDLGDPPRMGLAAVGRLTRQFDLSVDVSSASPYGGVRAVLRVDSHLLSRLDPAARPPAASAPRTTRTASRKSAAPTHSYGPEGDVPETPQDHAPYDTDGLPQRRRRNRVAVPTEPTETAERTSRPEPQWTARRPEDAAAALGALQSGTAAARAEADAMYGAQPPTAPSRADAEQPGETAATHAEHTNRTPAPNPTHAAHTSETSVRATPSEAPAGAAAAEPAHTSEAPVRATPADTERTGEAPARTAQAEPAHTDEAPNTAALAHAQRTGETPGRATLHEAPAGATPAEAGRTGEAATLAPTHTAHTAHTDETPSTPPPAHTHRTGESPVRATPAGAEGAAAIRGDRASVVAGADPVGRDEPAVAGDGRGGVTHEHDTTDDEGGAAR